MKSVAYIIIVAIGFAVQPVMAANNAAPSVQAKTTPAAQSPSQLEYLSLLRAVLETAKENNEHLKTTITVGGAMIGIIVALFALFGYREVRAFLSPLSEKLTKLEADYSSKSDGLTKKLEAKLHHDISALLETGLGLNYLEMATSDTAHLSAERKRELLADSVSHMERALNRDAPEDSALVVVIQGHLAYALKRLDRVPDAFNAAVSGFKAAEKCGNGERQAILAFNAACYACLQGNTETALHWIDIAVKLDGHNAQDAWGEDDLAPLRGNELFKKIVGHKTAD
jgi:hypothetical protein